jgi:hypothetical protein
VKEVADFAPNPGCVGMGGIIMIMVGGMGHLSTCVSLGGLTTQDPAQIVQYGYDSCGACKLYNSGVANNCRADKGSCHESHRSQAA